MTPDNSIVAQGLAEDSRPVKEMFDENELIDKHELIGQTTEFGTMNPDIFTIVEDEKLAEQPDPLAPIKSDDIIVDSDYDRPHTKNDDSSTMIDGAVQATTKQLCNIKSTSWASDIIGLHQENPAHTRTQVIQKLKRE